MKFSKRVSQLKPSPTLALSAKAKELKAAGKDVISLSVGEPDWDTFEFIKQAAIQSIADGKTKYAPSSGVTDLREAVAQFTSQQTGCDFLSDNVSISTGGKFILYAALQCLVSAGDEVIIPSPYWVSYPSMVDLAGGVSVCVQCDKADRFKLSPDLLKAQISDATKVVILNSPSNPTGFMYSEEELKSLAEVLLEYPRAVVISDDIYNALVLDREQAPHLLQVAPELKERTLIVNAASKMFAMTGWRVGWGVGPKELITMMSRLQSQSVSCASPFSQLAVVEALKNGNLELENVRVKLRERSEKVFSLLSTVPGLDVIKPDGAFYFWVGISQVFGKKYKGETLHTSRDFAQALLEDFSVVVVPGLDFGLDGYVRLSYALSESEMETAVSRIKSFVKKLED